MNKIPQKDPGPENSSLINFGWTMAGEFLFCFFAGFYADQKFATGYRFTLAGLGAAVLLIVYELWKMIRRQPRD